MNKILATAAASLMFLACGDNSSVGPSSTGSVSLVRNFSAPCIYSVKADVSENNTDNLTDLEPLENIARIYPANSDGFSLVTIEHIKLGCSYDIVGADVNVEGDTLFVNTKIEGEDDNLDCLCPRKVSFEVKNDSSFENVKYTKVAGYFVLPLLKMEPDNQSSSSVAESSSSVIADLSLITDRDIALHLGECRGPGFDLNKDGSSSDTDKAYLIMGETGYQVFIPNLSDYCLIDGKWMSERVGDTLRVWIDLEWGAVSKCICIKDHWFDISAKDTDIKYFEYSGVVYEVVKGE